MQILKITNRNTIFTAKENATSTVNTGIIRGKTHNFIIDTGTGGDFTKAMLNYLGDDPLPIVVINTHHHWDHVYGNWMFEGNQIIAHKLCAEFLDNDWTEKMEEVKAHGAVFHGEVHKCLPNRLIDAPLYFPDDGVLIFPNPGHSVDCISVFDEIDKILYLGDNFGIDEDGLSYWGYEDTEEDETAPEEEVDARYEASFYEMMKFLSQYDYESAVVSHGGHISRADFAELEEDFAD
ncbi:MAG: MBL fold metallo-hydrolase [Oscillospiraceae bacterium]|nr:MBL fold metallo-hydrolase [Oscillospiraceae bacterium]